MSVMTPQTLEARAKATARDAAVLLDANPTHFAFTESRIISLFLFSAVLIAFGTATELPENLGKLSSGTAFGSTWDGVIVTAFATVRTVPSAILKVRSPAPDPAGIRSAEPDLVATISTFLPFKVTLEKSEGFTSFITTRPPLLLKPVDNFGAREFRIGAWKGGSGIRITSRVTCEEADAVSVTATVALTRQLPLTLS